MRFTLGMVTALLSGVDTRNYISGDRKTKTYRWVSLLPKDERDLDPDILYVCRTSEALQYNFHSADIHFVTVNDTYLGMDERTNRERFQNILIVADSSRGVPWILKTIQDRFLELNDWYSDLQRILINGGGYQELIDASEEIFKNSLFILDDVFRLIAYGKKYLSDDPMHTDLYRRGYYPTEVLDMWYSSGRIDVYRSNPGKTLWTDKIGRNPSISRWCRHDGILLIQGVLVFSHEQMADDAIDLFDVFMDAVTVHFERNISSNQGVLLPHNSFLIDVFNGMITDPQQIDGVAREIDMPVNGTFIVYRIAFHNIGKVLIGNFIQRLGLLLPKAKIVTNGSEVFVMDIIKESALKNDTKSTFQVILPLLEEHDGICGISFPYTRLRDMRAAGMQALYALQFGPKAKKLLPGTSRSDRFFFYSDVISLYMVDTARKGELDPMYNNIYREKLASLWEFDRKNDSSLYDILFVYLVNERRATDAAEKLHMHRSTVIYHIQRITELLEMNLNEFLVRQGLITAYMSLMLEGTEVLNTSPEG